ncbi:MAG: septation ring formation regulator EzrA [Bacilli bacterium]|nr:septation ring formation regulator EzrA [Bacilli bacterium]
MNLDIKIIVIIMVVIILLIITTVFGVLSYKKKQRLSKLDFLQNRIDTLKALPVQYLLNKVSLMPKSDETNLEFEKWVKIYKILSTEKGDVIKKELNTIEGLVYGRKFKDSSKHLVDLEKDINDYENQYNQLLNELTQATQIDVKNREELTNQKELFRNYKKMYKTNFDSYTPFNSAIERYFISIQDAFANIDLLLNESQVDKAKIKAANLDGELLMVKDILNNLPVILDELRKEIPTYYKNVEQRYNDVLNKKFHINHLNIPSRLKQLNNDIINALSKNHEVLLNDLHTIIKDSNLELNLISKELDEEIRCHEQLELGIQDLVGLCIDADKLCKSVNVELQKVNLKYYLFPNEEDNLNMETNLLFDCIMQKNDIVSQYQGNKFIASDLNKQTLKLIPRIKGLIMAFSAYEKHLDDLQADEKRLLDEHVNMLYIIKDCEARLRIMNLPILSQAYYQSIEECKEGVDQVDAYLKEHPLDIIKTKSLSSEVNENVYRLYDNSRNLLKTAQMAENTITFVNRYRSSYPEIETILTRSEIFFSNGEYTKSLSSAIEAVEFLYPEVKKELFDYRSLQLKQAPM